MASTDPAADVFQARAELYAPSRLPPKALELFRTRALVTDVIAQQCWLVVLADARLRLEASPRGGDGVPRVAIIGGGHMGCAVAMALLDHAYPSHRILIATRQPERLLQYDVLATAASQTHFQQMPCAFGNSHTSRRKSDVLVMCVPPSQLTSVAIQIRHAPCVVVSLLSGMLESEWLSYVL